jgi:hypothetical protein
LFAAFLDQTTQALDGIFLGCGFRLCQWQQGILGGRSGFLWLQGRRAAVCGRTESLDAFRFTGGRGLRSWRGLGLMGF